jgi:enoyl-CoA hydratase/carnithine racemase
LAITGQPLRTLAAAARAALATTTAIRRVSPKALTWLVSSAVSVDAATAVAMGLASGPFLDADFASETEAFLGRLAARPRLGSETVMNFHMKAWDMVSEAASDCAGALFALLHTTRG